MAAECGGPAGVIGLGWAEKGVRNNEDKEISGSNKKPETHIRAKASRLRHEGKG
jgi:hypothetical protein